MLGFLRNRRRSEHDWVEESLSAYVDGELSARETARVEEHLRECHACAQDLATLRQTVALLRELPSVDAPRSFAVRPTPVRPKTRVAAPAWGYGLLKGATALAALLFVLLIGGDLAFRFVGGFRLAAPVPLAPAAEVALAPSPRPSVSPLAADEELVAGETKAMDTATVEATPLIAEELPAPAAAPTEAPVEAYQAAPPEGTAAPERERAEGADWAGTPTPSGTPIGTLPPEEHAIGAGVAEPTAVPVPAATPPAMAMANVPTEDVQSRGEAYLQPQILVLPPLRLAELVALIVLLILIPTTILTGWLTRKRRRQG